MQPDHRLLVNEAAGGGGPTYRERCSIWRLDDAFGQGIPDSFSWDLRVLPEDGEEGRKWREDVGKLKTEWQEFDQALQGGKDLARVGKAQSKLAADLEDAFATAAGKAADKAMDTALDQPVWMWQDIFNAYLPRLLDLIKDIPIPR